MQNLAKIVLPVRGIPEQCQTKQCCLQTFQGDSETHIGCEQLGRFHRFQCKSSQSTELGPENCQLKFQVEEFQVSEKMNLANFAVGKTFSKVLLRVLNSSQVSTV